MVQPLPIPAPVTPDSPENRVRTQARRAPWWVDALLLLGLAAAGYGVSRAAVRWSAPLSPNVQVDLSPRFLPLYAGMSTLRMAIAYLLSLVFALVYAKGAATSRAAERVMMPVLDILQSVPILSFMPGVVLGLAALFPGRTIGLELAAVILIFTSQAWNLAFSFHQSLITIPKELSEAAAVYRLSTWKRFSQLELPFGAIALIANSMMSWAGGWFFLMASEQFVLGTSNLRLPGLGSYLAGAAEAGNGRALTLGLLTLIVVIVLLDQLLWRPLVAWSDRFKFEQSGGDEPTSAILDALRESVVVDWLQRQMAQLGKRLTPRRPLLPVGLRRKQDGDEEQSWVQRLPSIGVGLVFVWLVCWGGLATFHTLVGLSGREWGLVFVSAGATFLRTSVALALGALWTIPVGVAIGTNPKWARRAQPVVQVIASVPATAIFPVFLLALLRFAGGLNIAAIALMLLGTQWYVLFNVIAGAMAIPSDLKEAAITYHVTGWRRWRTLTLPAIFPYLVTGMITATGGAWNASIVSEYVTFANQKVSTVGLGAVIAKAADKGNFPLLLAATLVMAAIVITGNRLVWRRLYRLAESRYRLG